MRSRIRFLGTMRFDHIPIDVRPEMANNIRMSIDTTKPPTQEEADHRHMLDHAFKGKPLDPEVSKRVQARADAIRAKLPLTNIAVDLIRELRDEE